MNIPKLNQLLEKEVSRKEFLQHMGVITVGILGITALQTRFNQSIDQQVKKVSSKSSNSYGTRTYGG